MQLLGALSIECLQGVKPTVLIVAMLTLYMPYSLQIIFMYNISSNPHKNAVSEYNSYTVAE